MSAVNCPSAVLQYMLSLDTDPYTARTCGGTATGALHALTGSMFCRRATNSWLHNEVHAELIASKGPQACQDSAAMMHHETCQVTITWQALYVDC